MAARKAAAKPKPKKATKAKGKKRKSTGKKVGSLHIMQKYKIIQFNNKYKT